MILPAISSVVTACVIGAAASQSARTNMDVLQTAKRLGDTTFREHQYGSKGEKRVDCVQFVIAVVEELGKQQGQTIDPALKKAIAIDLGAEPAKLLQTLVNQEDERIKGVQAALVAAGLGHKVSPSEAKAGDFVQYWYQDREGSWRGHAGIVESIDSAGRATIYGSHRSTLQRERSLFEDERKGGVGSGPVFRLTGSSRKVFVVRWTGPRASPDPATQ